MKFFGARYAYLAYVDAQQVKTPVGLACGHCGEPVAAGDDGWLMAYLGDGPAEMPFHRECQLRMVIGSVAHQKHWCSCYVPGSGCEDDPALTRRQAARAAMDYFFQAHA